MTTTLEAPAETPQSDSPPQTAPAEQTWTDATTSGRRRRLRALATSRLLRPKPPAAALGQSRMTIMVVALTLCALALWSLVYLLIVSSLQHARIQHELYTKLRAELAQATAPLAGPISIGAPVAVLSIPAAGLHGEVVVEGTTPSALRSGPGHLRTTPLPGEIGTSVLYGRSLSFGAPFAELVGLKAGDAITVSTDQGVFHFHVRDVRRPGDAFTVPAAGTASLTLVSTAGGWTPDRIVYVDAALSGKPAGDPGGRPTTLGPQERLMANDTDPVTLTQVVLWLQLLVVALVGSVWLAKRWRRGQLWLVAAPIVLAALWGLSNAAAQLLPNVL
ncbi:sortase [uncultured Jatrophihabitans sp.]|uniref:sortase n=1 Tax=uncultured Jatrophihabitans sp. TaxID=1610747 RepID=UPI0035C94819